MCFLIQPYTLVSLKLAREQAKTRRLRRDGDEQVSIEQELGHLIKVRAKRYAVIFALELGEFVFDLLVAGGISLLGEPESGRRTH